MTHYVFPFSILIPNQDEPTDRVAVAVCLHSERNTVVVSVALLVVVAVVVAAGAGAAAGRMDYSVAVGENMLALVDILHLVVQSYSPSWNVTAAAAAAAAGANRVRSMNFAAPALWHHPDLGKKVAVFYLAVVVHTRGNLHIVVVVGVVFVVVEDIDNIRLVQRVAVVHRTVMEDMFQGQTHRNYYCSIRTWIYQPVLRWTWPFPKDPHSLNQSFGPL